jgi:hypothetical protein
MNISRTITLTAALTLTALTACGTSSRAPSTPDPSASPPATTPAFDCGDQDQPQAAWVEHCAATKPPLAAATVGKAFTYSQVHSDGSAPTAWKITVDTLKCGLTAIPRATRNPAWQGDDQVPEYLSATPPPGKTFCKLRATFVNVGSTPGGSGAYFGDIETTAGTIHQTDQDWDITDRINQSAPQANPGDFTWVEQVWSVPTGARLKAVAFPETNAAGGPQYTIKP